MWFWCDLPCGPGTRLAEDDLGVGVGVGSARAKVEDSEHDVECCRLVRPTMGILEKPRHHAGRHSADSTIVCPTLMLRALALLRKDAGCSTWVRGASSLGISVCVGAAKVVV